MLEDANLVENKDLNAQAEERNWGSTFTAGGSTYAASLFWQPLRNSDDPYTEITDASENILEGADLFALRRGKIPQYGLCISSQALTQF